MVINYLLTGMILQEGVVRTNQMPNLIIPYIPPRKNERPAGTWKWWKLQIAELSLLLEGPLFWGEPAISFSGMSKATALAGGARFKHGFGQRSSGLASLLGFTYPLEN